MNERKIEILKAYKQMLLEYKKMKLLNQISMKEENKLSSINKPKRKVLTLFKQ